MSGTNYEFSLNVCGPLVADGSTCGADQGGCQKQVGGGTSTWNLGAASSSLALADGGSADGATDTINLIYTGGTPCHSNAYNRSTLIMFTCKPGSLGQPKFITETDECRYIFQWETSLACVDEDDIGLGNCRVKDTSSNVIYDLSSLTKSTGGYQFQDDDYTYLINVCAPIGGTPGTCVDSRTGACQTAKSDGRSFRLGAATDVLEYAGGILRLRYTTGDACHNNQFNRSLLITFSCARGQVGAPRFVDETGDCSYLFDWATDAACGPADPDDNTLQCSVTDPTNGNQFDLSPLTRTNGNWEAVDTRQGAYFKYLINVCRPVNPVATGTPGFNCSSKAGACQTRNDQPAAAFHLGVPSSPYLLNGGVALQYNFGTPCHNNQYNRSMLITFSCNPGVVGVPTFITETPECQYVFSWATSAACVLNPGGGDVVGSNCRVTDPISNNVFDLSGLARSDRDYSVTASDGFTYKMNVCAPLVDRTKCTSANAGVCQTLASDATFSKLAGVANSRLTYSSGGVLTLTYPDGQSCHSGQFNRSTVISFTCARGQVGAPVFVDETDDCSYLFTWATDAACRPSDDDEIDCAATDPSTGIEYDLSPLSRATGNWEASDSRQGYAFRYFINVCQPVNPVAGSLCPVQAGACQALATDLSVAYSLGRPAAPVFADGSLKLEYDLGTPCHSNAFNRSMLITFTCAAETLGVPTFVTETADCQYVFQWASSAACAPTNGSSSGDCRVTNPSTNQIFDFSGLTRTTGSYSVTVGDYQYDLNVCGALPASSPCSSKDSKSAACQTKPSDSSFSKVLGVTGGELTYSNGFITLEYDNGQACHDSEFNRSTLIIFSCARGQVGAPVFVQESADCVYIFNWATDAACPPSDQLECMATHPTTGRQYDLSPLIKTIGNWEALDSAEGDSYRYLINVCHAINPDAYSNKCNVRSAACQLKPTDPDFAHDLGLPAAPTFTNGALTLQYSLGSSCHNGQFNRSVLITFTCKQGSLGVPKFVTETDQCQYMFMWETSVACDANNGTASTGCRTVDPLTNEVYDLSPLSAYQADYSVAGNGYIFKLNVCAPLKAPCGTATSAMACQTQPLNPNFKDTATGLATPQTSSISYSSGVITLQYTGGQSCHDGQFNRTTIIMFTCARGVIGAPVYVSESSDCTYTFTWATDFACPSSDALECVVRDPKSNTMYDLSVLTRADTNWEALDSRQGFNYRYFINVCHAIVPTAATAACNSRTGGCQVSNSNSSKVYSLGYPAAPTISAGGVISLQYDLGTPCHSNAFNRSMLITFTCKRNSLGQPTFIDETPDCRYVFNWETSAACAPISNGTTGDCRVTNTLTGDVFDFSTLTSSGSDYQIASGDYVYNLNVCGRTNTQCGNNPNAAMCQTKPSDASFAKSGGSVSSTLTFNNGIISLQYYGGQSCHDGQFNRSTIITFTCARGQKGSPVFVSESDDCVYFFTWATDAACTAGDSIQCIARDPATGIQYDLNPLARDSGNWQAVDTRDGGAFQYFINVCRAINPVAGTSCSVQSGACQAQTSNMLNSWSLGRPSGPQFANGVLTLKYDLGTPCHSNAFNRSMVITFTCKPESLGVPKFITETNDCQYIFQWESSVACAPSNGTGNGDCRVVDSLTNNVFDLSSLASSASDYAVTGSDGFVYQLNVCRDLVDHSKCAEPNAAACQTKATDPGFGKLAGRISTSLTYNDGAISLKYEGGSACHNGAFNRSTLITFTCAPGQKGAPAFVLETGDCGYVFNWATDAACPADTDIECLTFNPATGEQFDLSPLIKSTGNWEALDTRDGGTYKYLINVCHALNPTSSSSSVCPARSGACQTKPSDTTFGHDLGLPAGPTIKNGQLTLEYDLGSSCHQGQYNRSMLITFACKPDTLGVPRFIAETDDCQYVFQWDTAAACAVNNTTPVTDDCRVVDPRTNNVYDLSGLTKTTGDYTVGAGDYSYHLNVCGKLSSVAPCKNSKSAVCQTKVSDASFGKDGGVASSSLKFNDGVISLQYTGGSSCHDGAFNRSTVITFTCARGKVGSPIFVQETNDCTYFFTWATDAACPPADSIECLVSDPTSGVQYDFSSLTRTSGNWEALDTRENGKFKYLINVCHAINPVAGVSCDPKSGACQTSPSDATFTNYNLGLPAAPSVVDGTIVLQYVGGTPCHNNAYQRSTLIKFSCKAETLGSPVFITETESCQYVFLWETSAACGPANDTTGTDCQVADPSSGAIYDLRPLASTTDYSFLVGSDKYTINMCKPLVTQCGTDASAGACRFASTSTPAAGTVLGHASTTPLLSNGQLSLNMSGGAACGSGSRNVIVSFSCNTASLGQPVFVTLDSCNVYLRWETSAACGPNPNEGMCTAHDAANGFDYNLGVLTRSETSWTTAGKSGARFFLNVCDRAFGSPCGDTAASCQSNNGLVIDLGRSSRALQVTGEGKLSLTYTGNQFCVGTTYYTTKINFVCARGILGSPVFEGVTNNCQYTFTWKTSAACPVTAPATSTTCAVYDPLTSNVFNVTRLSRPTSNYVVDAYRGGVLYRYQLNLCREAVSTQCPAGTAVCETRPDVPTYSRAVGKVASTLQAADGALSMTFARTNQQCDDVKYTPSSIIMFSCRADSLGEPTFLYRSESCDYVFSWASSVACINYTPEPHPTDNNNSAASSNKTQVTVIAVVVILVVLVLAMGFLLRKKSRRTALMAIVLRPFSMCSRNAQTSYYSSLGRGTDLERVMASEDDDDLMAL
ncbi:hypothetical protein, variant 2 [Capsaspora owczarzaki ATCC 30864]|nr:hypothetical protein, variant 1 [Capsaspora owczarzaki ATCC 30864]KJE92775.1 hypothetical protein, variant 2 [Capsaspora owczarzaki ATCC 30864]